MNIDIVLLNIYYVGITIAFLVREILWLRIIMILAGGAVISYGILTSNVIVILWNSLFMGINTIHVVWLVMERKPAIVDDEMQDLYKTVFYEMSEQEFLYFLDRGVINQTANERICVEGEIQDSLSLIISGRAVVRKNSEEMALLGRGCFIAEMGFITHKPASADVYAEGVVKYISWSREQIHRMSRVYPNLGNKLQLILSKDLVHKLEEYNEKKSP